MKVEERPRCPVCGQRDCAVILETPFDRDPIAGYLDRKYGSRLDRGPLVDAEFTLRRCPDCELIFQSYAPDPGYAGHIYGAESVYDVDATRNSRGLEARRNYANEVEQLLTFLGRPPNEVSMLDFGAGSGLWLQMAAGWGCDVTGAELTADGRARIESLGYRALSPDELPERAFDYVNSEQVFEHLTDPGAAIRAVTRSLRPGGILRLSVPNGSNIPELVTDPDWEAPKGSARSLNAIAPLEHLNCFNHNSLVRLGTSEGLTPFQYPTRQFLQQFSRVRFAASALVHAVRPPSGTMLLFRRSPG